MVYVNQFLGEHPQLTFNALSNRIRRATTLNLDLADYFRESQLEPLWTALYDEVQASIELHAEVAFKIAEHIEKPLRERMNEDKNWQVLKKAQIGMSSEVKTFAEKDSRIAKLKKTIEERKSSRKAHTASEKLNNTAMAFETSKQHWKENMQPVIEQYELVDRSRLELIKALVAGFEDLQIVKYRQRTQQAETVKNVAARVDVEEDLRQVCRDRKILAAWVPNRASHRDSGIFNLPRRASLKSKSESPLFPASPLPSLTLQRGVAMSSPQPTRPDSPDFRGSPISQYSIPVSNKPPPHASPVPSTATLPAARATSFTSIVTNSAFTENHYPLGDTTAPMDLPAQFPVAKTETTPVNHRSGLGLNAESRESEGPISSRLPPLVANVDNFYSDDSDQESTNTTNQTPKVKFSIKSDRIQESSEQSALALSRLAGTLRSSPSVRRRGRRDMTAGLYEKAGEQGSAPNLTQWPVASTSSLSLPPPIGAVYTSATSSMSLTSIGVMSNPSMTSTLRDVPSPFGASVATSPSLSSADLPGTLTCLREEALHVRCSAEGVEKVIITGEIKLRLTNVGRNDIRDLPVRLHHRTYLENLIINPKYLSRPLETASSSPVPASSSTGPASDLYHLTVEGPSAVSSSSSERFSATVVLLKYQEIIPDHEKERFTPLRLSAMWKNHDWQTSLLVTYEPNPMFGIGITPSRTEWESVPGTGAGPASPADPTSLTLQQLSVTVPLKGQVQQIITKPDGRWNAEKQRLTWFLGPVTPSAASTGALLPPPPSLSTTSVPSSPSSPVSPSSPSSTATKLLLRAQTQMDCAPTPISVQFTAQPGRLSRIRFTIETPTSHRPLVLAEPEQTLRAGKYLVIPPMHPLKMRPSLTNLSFASFPFPSTPSPPLPIITTTTTASSLELTAPSSPVTSPLPLSIIASINSATAAVALAPTGPVGADQEDGSRKGSVNSLTSPVTPGTATIESGFPDAQLELTESETGTEMKTEPTPTPELPQGATGLQVCLKEEAQA
ncbi:hypothetical protein H4R33_004587 [Dimargaris cristalligena]|nr:hypothetical protein H4R33_004587 [Dimargaris cristalligena]